MHSIRTQVSLFIALLLVLLLAVLNTYPITSSRDLVVDEKYNSLSKQAAVVSSSLSGLDRLSPEGVSEVLSLLDVTGVQRLVIINDETTVLYDGRGRIGRPTDLEALLTALQTKTVFHSSFTEQAFVSEYAMPVVINSATAGAVYLYEYDTDSAAIIYGLKNQVRTLSILVSVATAIIVLVFMYVMLQRIRDLVASMRIVAGGDYRHRLAVRGRDEISELGHEFNRLTVCLDENEQQRRRFVSDASHELKTPLAAIRLLTDSIVQTNDMPPEMVREFVDDIGSEAVRLQRTTEKLLALSRLDDDIQVMREPVDVSQTILDVCSALAPIAAERSVTLNTSLEDGCVVMATVDDMYHIVFNLVENAIKYNLPEGSVKIWLNQDEVEVHVTVEDTGIGIPEAERLNIFTRFYRIDKARSREAGGSGLGLSIVHDTVKAHNGTITVGSNRPQGSRFMVSFPRPTPEETGI
ncbi:MAG: HAMP domain-containing histidine kinase [Oscillospiraceae bacterium]|nr:HAMP domain-containing histidine kinase [Oscillospiraceae bacterium]